MQPIRPMRPTATSWVQMSAAGVPLQQQETTRSSLSSVKTSTSSSTNSSLSTTNPAQLGANFETQALTSAANAFLTAAAAASAAGSSSSNQQNSSLLHDLSLQQSSGIDQQQQVADEEQQQEENRKLRLQLYVLVLRCISYSFNAKPTNTNEGLHQRQQQLKLRKAQLEQIIQLHTRYIKSHGSFAPNRCPHQHLKFAHQAQLKQLDELYERCQITFNRKFLQNERMRMLVESECCSQQDLRELFRQNAEKLLKESKLFDSSNSQQQQMRRSHELEDSSLSANIGFANKDVVINSWLIKFESIIREDLDNSSASVQNNEPTSPFNSTTTTNQLQQVNSQSGSSSLNVGSSANGNNQQAFSKEHLYQMFQNILNIKKFEHQLLYNALQLDSSDEQAAAIRRELDGRIARIAELERNKKLMPKFVLKEMESLYLEESRMSVNKLMVNLDSLPVMKGNSNESRGVYGLQKFRRYNNRAQASLTREGLVESHPSEPQLTKLDVVLTFNIEVIVMEVRGLRQLAPNREIYCTLEIEGSEKLQTEHVQAKKPLWDTQGDFTTNHPLPVLKIKLYAVNPSMLSLEDKELGKLVLRPTVLSPKTPEWCSMQATSSNLNQQPIGSGANGPNASQSASDQELKIRVIVRMDRPQQLKHCGYLYGIGKSTWRKLKRRYHILIQVSQYTFVMCSYRDKKSKPTEMLQLEGYTVDYIEPPTDLIMEHCSEITSNEHQHHHAAGSSALGLAGRLANVILKQPAGGIASSEGGESVLAGSSQEADSSSSAPSAIQTAAALSDELHSKYYFNVVKEGDSVVFACDDEQECFGWVMALYRATGQAHKPTPLRNQYSGSTSHYIDAAFAYNTSAGQQTKLVGNSTVISSALGSNASSSLSISSMTLNGSKAKSSVDVADQRARKHGMDEFISADPCKFQHNHLFKYLQNETLKYRLNDLYCSLGWFSPGQVLVLDEYCARYGVRTCFRHLAYLDSLLEFNQRGYFIDHTLLNYGYDFCASHVSGNSGQAHPMGSVNFDLRPDGIGTVTVEERDMFHSIKAKLLKMIERQISNFFYCFPFGKPDGALKANLSLLERVLMKEQQTNSMLQNEEVRSLIRKCLEQAALNNYTKLSGQANLLDLQVKGQSSPAGSACSPSPDGEQIEQSVSALIRPTTRTSSNLSNSSILSYASSSLSSTQPASLSSDSMRHQQRPQEQQQQQCLTMAMIINNEHMKAKDKLRYLTRLAELCCEQVEENNEYFSEAFAWHSDLMKDHFELFWSLFSVDMDKILNELSGSVAQTSSHQQQQQQQAPLAASHASLGSISLANNGDLMGVGNREVFALFLILNNHMRKSPNLECRKFKTYLCDTFKPKLLRHIDIMESTLTRMLFKAFEKDGQVNCALLEQMYTRLDELQRFVLYQLRWPDDHLAEQLHQRLKLIAYELCDASVQRTQQAFQQSERKASKWTATNTNYTSHVDMIQMINLTLETRNRSLKLCTFNNFDQMSYHSKIDKFVETAMAEMQPGLLAKLMNALESTLTKLARYDEGNLLAPILSLTYKQGMSSSGRDIGKQYATFVSNCCDSIRQKINDELWIVNLLEEWYACQMSTICNWLGERMDHSLHDVQLAALTNIMPKVYADMSLQGVSEEKLNLKTYQIVMSRLKMEEAAASAGGSLFEQPNTSIFTTSILSSLTSSSSASASNSIPSASSNTVSPPTALMATSGASQSTPMRQPASFQQQKLDSPSGSLQSRRFVQPLNSSSSANIDHPTADGQQQESDNIADRAFQGATRMFKGFWAS